MYTWLLTFVAIYLLIATFHSRDDKAWMRALIITIFFYVAFMAIQQFGVYGYIGALVAGLFVIMQVLNYGLAGAFIFLVAVDFIQIAIGWGVEKYIG